MDTNMPEGQWPEHAKRLLQEMAVREPDQSMIDQIIGCLLSFSTVASASASWIGPDLKPLLRPAARLPGKFP